MEEYEGMQDADYYQILKLDREASQKEIKRAYRKLAREYHPDVSILSDAEEKFKEMGEAYEVLKNPKKREEYDRLNNSWQGRQEDSQPSYSSQNHYGFDEARYNEKHAAELNSAFDDLFGGAQKSRRYAEVDGSGDHRFDTSGRDIHARVMIDLQDSLMGASRQFTLTIPVTTPQGALVNQRKTLTVKIPKGILEGECIRVPKKGCLGMGAAAGDLLLEVGFNMHECYTVEGKDIYVNFPVTAQALALGTRVQIHVPNSRSRKVSLIIPENSQQGSKICLKGYGIPSQYPGDFYVVLQVSV
ncbi:MAG: Cytochrome C biogenesis protein [uncultured Thiotrichaceae bacterium]|uniref:Cytochrome C biogenesis protein n=1 Tax=uncultured Thiotrichaceae bacterium TaxID=298394 RepID=A0A6S6SFT2_9GAMM|nr:MAG: Cytochrome C biogenesis protein [uncultured Thiotrichaceae bacterium]